MTRKLKMKYWEIIPPGDDPYSIVLAKTVGQAKSKFIKGKTIHFFEGWYNGDYDFTDLKARRIKSLDGIKPDDDFHILKALILKDDWRFQTASDPYEYLDQDNYTDKRLRRYLKTGEVITDEEEKSA